MSAVSRKNRIAFIFVIALLTLPLPLWGQMAGGGMHSNEGNYGGGNTVSHPSGPMSGPIGATSGSGMEGFQLQMNSGPFINNNAVFTLTRHRTPQTDLEAGNVFFDWVLSAFNLLGSKQWTVTLRGDHLSAPTFTPDGKLFLVARNGMRGMLGAYGFPVEGDDLQDLIQISSVLYVVSPGTTSAVVKEIRIENELASNAVVSAGVTPYLVYLTTRSMDLENWNFWQVPMHDANDLSSRQFLYAFDSNGVGILRIELP